MLRLVLTLVRLFDIRLDGERLPTGKAKARVLNAVDGALKAIPLKTAFSGVESLFVPLPRMEES